MGDRITELGKNATTEICRLYGSSNLTTTEICKMYNIGCGTLQKIINQAGIPNRRTSKKIGHIKSNNEQVHSDKSLVCPHCGSIISDNNAKYCCMCGKKLLSVEDIKQTILDNLGVIRQYCKDLPTISKKLCENGADEIEQLVKSLH